ncbi:Flavodoxin [Succinivibrio dextrinosolvens]|uniref:flavodoxin n=1 Tax=Succinivibrio dextrinosolvens TaxID=83771 RepID=UPI0008DFFB8C|nr:flavodoxin [Succinivibrio dextrinosolvens]SFS78791.1 Flavodoxin [Succinivibrio dextrinosolvens]
MKSVLFKLVSSFAAIILSGFACAAQAANSDTLVMYFSATGNTSGLATTAATVLGADIKEIVPVSPYTMDDLNYHEPNCRANLEQQNKAVRPEIKDLNIDLTSYKTIVLAYPLWWAEEPRIIDTFVESYDFSGKTIVPICTSGGSDIQKSIENIKKLVKGNAVVKNGRRFSGNTASAEFKSWFDSIL